MSTIHHGRTVFEGTRGCVVEIEYNPGNYLDLGLPRPQYAVEYKGDTLFRTDSLEQARQAVE
jgi:hypothetical protein